MPLGCRPYLHIPVHRPRPVIATGSATLCYHGNADHIVLATNMHAGICRLAQQTGLHLKVQVQVGSNSGKLHLPDLARCPGVSLIQRYWRNQTTTFQRLVNCNVGLVPNTLDVETPTSSSLKANHSHAIAIPHIAYQWKTSANGGRAMVFAHRWGYLLLPTPSSR